MSRIIKASDVKPGQRIRWTEEGTTMELTVAAVRQTGCTEPSLQLRNSAGRYEYTYPNTVVAVVSEPQPEEPQEFGARVVVNGDQFIRGGGDSIYIWEDLSGTCFTWNDLLGLGPVTIIPDQGWTVPDDDGDNEEVPLRIEEWPEDDTELRKYKWADGINFKWAYFANLKRWRYMNEGGLWITHEYSTRPLDGPWTRVDGEGA